MFPHIHAGSLNGFVDFIGGPVGTGLFVIQLGSLGGKIKINVKRSVGADVFGGAVGHEVLISAFFTLEASSFHRRRQRIGIPRLIAILFALGVDSLQLGQLQATDPEGNWTVYSMAQAFANEGYEGEEGAYQHFLDYGMAEEVSPNALFDAETYYANKLASLQSNAETAEEWADKTVDDVKAAFDEAGLSAWEHYQQYGTAEGINPSAEFDTAKYLQAKADALNAVGGDKVWTAEDVAEAFADAGLNALEHYELYGKSGAEGEVAEGYNPAPIVTLTFADALAAETLPDEYFLADGAASLEGVAVADLEAAQAEAQSIFDGALNKADLEYSVDYTLTDTLANLMAADAAVVEGAAGYELTDGSIDLGDGSVEDITAAIADAQAVIDGAANAEKPVLEASYVLNDSIANLMDADDALLDAAAGYMVTDALENIIDRDNTEIVNGASSYTLTDGVLDLEDQTVLGVKSAVEAAEAAIAKAANADDVTLTVAYTLTDTLANLMDPENADMFEGASSYEVTDGIVDFGDGSVEAITASIAEAQAIINNASNVTDGIRLDAAYTLTDTLENIMAAGDSVLIGGHPYTLTDGHAYTLTDGAVELGNGSVADITAAIADAQAVIDGATNADGFTLDATYTLEDSLQNLMAADAALLEGHTYTLTDATVDLGDGTVEAVEAAIAAAQAIIDGAANEAKPELVVTYTLNDTLANIMAADAALLEGHTYTLMDGAADLGVDLTIEAVTAAQAAAQAVIDGSADEIKPELVATYTLNDSLANIMNPDNAALVEGHAYSLLDGAADFGTDQTIEAVTAAQAAAQAVIDGSANETKPELAATYTLNDTLANIMAADAALVEGHTYTLMDGAADLGADLTIEAVTAAQAAAQAVIDGSANETKPELVATYTLNDSLANIMNPDNAALVEGHAYSLTDTVFDLGNNVTVAGIDAAKTAVADAAQAVIDAAANASGLDALTYTFVLNDSVANIAGLGGNLPDGATGYILTDSIAAINGASASLILGAEYYVLDDTLQNIMNADNAVLLQDAESYTLSAAEMTISGAVTVAAAKATLAEAQDVIDGAGNAAELTLDATFSLTDSVANLQSDSALLSQAQAYNIMDTASHIAEASAAFVGAAGDVTVADTLTAIDAASGVFAAGIDTVVAHVDIDTMISLATLNGLANASSTLNVAAGDTVAVSVNAADEATPVTIDLSALHATVGEGASITFNAIGSVGNDTITAHANGGIINGGLGDDTLKAGVGVDILTGAAGADTFTFATAATSTATATDHITDFVGGTDKIAFQNADTFEVVTVDGANGLADAVAKAFTAADVNNNAGIEALQFEYAGKTYFAIEAEATSDASGALVVDVTGVSGSVTEADFIAVI